MLEENVKILIIENIETEADLLKKALERRGYTKAIVHIINTKDKSVSDMSKIKSDVVQKIKDNHIDFIFFDLHLGSDDPELRAEKIIEKIMSSEELRLEHIPYVIFSSKAIISDIEDQIKSKAVAVIQKSTSTVDNYEDTLIQYALDKNIEKFASLYRRTIERLDFTSSLKELAFKMDNLENQADFQAKNILAILNLTSNIKNASFTSRERIELLINMNKTMIKAFPELSKPNNQEKIKEYFLKDSNLSFIKDDYFENKELAYKVKEIFIENIKNIKNDFTLDTIKQLLFTIAKEAGVSDVDLDTIQLDMVSSGFIEMAGLLPF